MAPGPKYPEPGSKRVPLHKSRTWLLQPENLVTTAGEKVAVEDAGAGEDPVRIKAIGKSTDLLRITHPPTSENKLLNC